MPITKQNLSQFGNESPRVAAYISIQRTFLAVGGIQLAMSVVFLVAAILLHFEAAGYVTIGVLAVVGASGLVFGKMSHPISAPFVLSRRIKRIKVFMSVYIFLLAVLFVLAVLTLSREFWLIIKRVQEEDVPPQAMKDMPYGLNAFEIVTCMAVILLAVIPMSAIGMGLHELRGSKPESNREGA
ncbi:hypothetical protein BV898_04776 [Hypsibius exemplaris]|uniref:Uncharacterized protein n=1 Tax=Hypsibius exemplaris TaxID=2072580 RepID=A0A1W0X1M1_HYPEX|nr:hypothetical protein BV898_04776 [Hypsibius exemplaris]